MELLGPIVRLQVQASSLKVGEPPRRRYDIGPLQAVASLTLEPGGVVGWTVGGERVDDVHHRNHPTSKHRDTDHNGGSVGFSSHYAAMRERFGDHLADGLAAENILVQTDLMLGEDDFAGGLLIETRDGVRVRLDDPLVATPCVEFTRFAMRFPGDARPDRTVSEALAFLDDGMRGYYVAYAGPPVRLRLGDRVWRV